MMMQARNHDHDDDGDPTKWYEVSASVGHLVLAVVLALVAGGATVFSYVWESHKAITLLQERQAMVLKNNSEDANLTVERERRIAQSLAAISHQVEELKLEIVRHMAAQQAVTDYSNGNAGIKRRQ